VREVGESHTGATFTKTVANLNVPDYVIINIVGTRNRGI
jgi:hypothetical protein